MNPIVTERTRVSVGGRVFEIPSEKTGQLISMLEGWKSLQVESERFQQQTSTWTGQTLLNG